MKGVISLLVHVMMFLFALLFIYAIIPYILSTWFSTGVYRKGKKNGEIALTFDDGPDPNYTPELLDLLRREGVKATFFLVGERAERYPELVLRIHREGHCIGIHNYVHHCNWLMAPWKNARALEHSARIIEKITGEKPAYYRPPWGMIQLFDFFLHRQFKMVLWSRMFRDWRKKGGSEKISQGLPTRVKSGDVILLHDCGVTWGADEDAPHYTIKGLRHAIPQLKKRGFRFVRIDEMFNTEPSSAKMGRIRKDRELIHE
mgnify:CR=1 FL=1